MALRNARPLTWRPRGLSDAIDGSNAFPGAMSMLANLVPAPHTKGLFVPRPAAVQLTGFSGVTDPAQVNALLQVGNIAYGMVAETGGTYAGKDVPYAYNVLTNTFETITIPGGTASLPATPATSGDWTPPCMAVVGSRIVITHPGYPGGTVMFGWLDISGLISTGITGSTHSTTTIDTLSSDVLQAGWGPGMTVTGTGIPANTTIVSIASDGLSMVISQAATATASGVALTVAGGTATAPLYGSGNTNGAIQLASVPTCVAQFNGRAWYGVGAAVVFSDSGNATQVTDSTYTQALTFQNGLPVTALAGLPLTNQQTGGIVQALIVFQGDANMYQITGDAATDNLALNGLGIGVGTLAPNTITPTPAGLAFIAPDGMRIINFLAQVSEPIGEHGDGVVLPFLNAIAPSRTCAAYNQNVYRVSVKNGGKPTQPVEEYFYDFSLKAWSGPHSFPAALIQPLQGTVNSFILAASGVTASLWQSDTVPSLSSSFTENGAAMAWTWQSVLLPDNEAMAENAIVESTFGAVLAPEAQLTIQALDEAGDVLDTLSWGGSGAAPAEWGSFNWGQSNWGAGTSFFVQYPLSWHQPLVFQQMSVRITGTSVAGLTLGNLHLRYQQLGYQTQQAAPAA